MSRSLTGFFVVALALALASCGGDDAGSPSTSTTSSTQNSDPKLDDVEPPAPRSEVGVGDSVDLGSGLRVTVVSVEAAELTAMSPGDVSGPGIVVTVEIENDTNDDVDLVGLVVNARSGEEGSPAPPNTSANEDRLSGVLAPGERTTGSYGFRVPSGEQGTLVIEVEHALAPSVAVVVVADAVN